MSSDVLRVLCDRLFRVLYALFVIFLDSENIIHPIYASGHRLKTANMLTTTTQHEFQSQRENRQPSQLTGVGIYCSQSHLSDYFNVKGPVYRDFPTLFKVVFSYRSCMSKDAARSTGHVGIFFFKKKKYSVTCKKSTRKVLINFGFVTSFEDSHYTLLFRYIYGARFIQ